jgi:hypothetical protein
VVFATENGSIALPERLPHTALTAENLLHSHYDKLQEMLQYNWIFPVGVLPQLCYSLQALDFSIVSATVRICKFFLFVWAPTSRAGQTRISCIAIMLSLIGYGIEVILSRF